MSLERFTENLSATIFAKVADVGEGGRTEPEICAYVGREKVPGTSLPSLMGDSGDGLP